MKTQQTISELQHTDKKYHTLGQKATKKGHNIKSKANHKNKVFREHGTLFQNLTQQRERKMKFIESCNTTKKSVDNQR